MALLTVEKLEPNETRTRLASDLPLRRMEFHKTDGCSDVMSLHLGKESEKEFELEIIEPIHVRLRDSRTGAKELEIRAENGTFFVTFHAGLIGNLLDGIAIN